MSTVTASRPTFHELRAREFGRLETAGHTYLDYAGAALYPASLVHAHAQALQGAILGNPHSDSPSSRACSAIIEDARARVLRFLDADPREYSVVFTTNCTAAAHLVASGFPFAAGSMLVLTADNHNSVNGIRAYASRAGAHVRYVALDDSLRALNVDHALQPPGATSPSLFAFPAQSNFSGVQHPLRLVGAAQRRGYRVLLDAAAFVPTHPLSLRSIQPDFVTLSFYKIFGFPTGVGALVARHDALAELTRPWFAGGTVDFVSVQHPMHRIKLGAEGFEDGTANFLGIAAITAGLDFIESIGIRRIERHVMDLAAETLAALRELKPAPGQAGVVVYGPNTPVERGATIAFNLVDGRGVVVPYETVEAHARAAGISIRGGCFCNPGAAEAAFRLPRARTLECLDDPAPFSIARLRACIGGGAVGALRCSFGVPSTRSDAATLLSLLRSLITRIP